MGLFSKVKLTEREEEIAGVLKDIQIFKHITPLERTKIAKYFREKEYDANKRIVKEGETGDQMFILENGAVKITKELRKGKEEVLANLVDGDCFGEMALMDCKPRSAAVKALHDCQAIQIKATQLAELYGLDHEQHLLIYMNLGREVCRRLSEADHRLFINRFSLDATDETQANQTQGHQ